jgi:hypothetical protein
MLCNARTRASERGLEFAIGRADIEIPDRCPVLGIPFVGPLSSGEPRAYFAQSYAPSIDRIDNARGYTADNIVVVSGRANGIKGDATVAELGQVFDFYTQIDRRQPR